MANPLSTATSDSFQSLPPAMQELMIADWAKKAGAEGKAILDAYAK